MGHPLRHFKTITRHRIEVRKLCFKAGLYWQGLTHDLSKYSPAEFIPGARYWQGNMSPQVMERKSEGYSAAWLHHKGRNKHHFEYWSDYVVRTGAAPVKMPKKYLVEMFCDRVAACKIYQGDNYNTRSALEYYERLKDHYDMHPATRRSLTELLQMLAEKGEDETMKYIRQAVLAGDKIETD